MTIKKLEISKLLKTATTFKYFRNVFKNTKCGELYTKRDTYLTVSWAQLYKGISQYRLITNWAIQDAVVKKYMKHRDHLYTRS